MSGRPISINEHNIKIVHRGRGGNEDQCHFVAWVKDEDGTFPKLSNGKPAGLVIASRDGRLNTNIYSPDGKTTRAINSGWPANNLTKKVQFYFPNFPSGRVDQGNSKQGSTQAASSVGFPVSQNSYRATLQTRRHRPQLSLDGTERPIASNKESPHKPSDRPLQSGTPVSAKYPTPLSCTTPIGSMPLGNSQELPKLLTLDEAQKKVGTYRSDGHRSDSESPAKTPKSVLESIKNTFFSRNQN